MPKYWLFGWLVLGNVKLDVFLGLGNVKFDVFLGLGNVKLDVFLGLGNVKNYQKTMQDLPYFMAAVI